MPNEPQYLEKPVQLIKEIPENAVKTWWGKTYYPGSEYYRLTAKGTMPRIYHALGSKLRKAVTTITEDEVTITGGGFGRKQVYKKGHYKYNFYIAFFDAAEKGIYIGWN